MLDDFNLYPREKNREPDLEDVDRSLQEKPLAVIMKLFGYCPSLKVQVLLTRGLNWLGWNMVDYLAKDVTFKY